MTPATEAPTQQRSELVEKLRLDRSSTRGARPRSTRKLVVIVAAILAVGVIAWNVLERFQAPDVRTAVARAATEIPASGSVLDASGYVTARRQATVSAKITGKVIEVLIEEGMRVEEGAVLARLDATEANAALALARAQLGAARSQVAEVEAQLDQAEREYTRQQSLVKQRATSVQAMDAARAQRDSLRARLLNTRDQIRVAEESVGVAQVQIDNTEVRAPFAGVVVAKAAQPGEMISPISAGGGFTRTGIGTIVDMDSLEIEVDVNESFINRVTAKQPVEAMLNAYPEWKIPGEVIAVIPAADRSKATVKVRIAILVKDPRIVPDMGVRVAFLSPKSDAPNQAAATDISGVLVPAEAVRSQGAEGLVFVYQDGKVALRRVTLGHSAGNDQHVLSGVDDGETVVLSPPDTLEDGDAVKVAETG
jgi:RND family efflux transporter MFP subunit